jgi:hypothetical protein
MIIFVITKHSEILIKKILKITTISSLSQMVSICEVLIFVLELKEFVLLLHNLFKARET